MTRVPDLNIKLQYLADERDSFIPFVHCKLIVVGSFIVLYSTCFNLLKATKGESTFISKLLRFPKEHCVIRCE